MNRKLPPQTTQLPVSSFRFPVSSLHHLNNSIPVHIIPLPNVKSRTTNYELPVTKIEFIFTHNSNSKPKTQNSKLISPLIPKLTLSMLTEGTQSFSAQQIAEKLDYLAVEFEKDTDPDTSNISITCLNKHLTKALPIISQIITQPTFPPSSLRLLTSIKQQQFILNQQKVNYLAKNQFRQHLFGKTNPYGRITTIDDFDNINSETIKTSHQQTITSSNCKIIISGNPPQNIISLLNKHIPSPFGQPPSHNTIPQTKNRNLAERSHEPQANKPQTGNPKLKSHLIPFPNAVQSAIRIGKILTTPNQPPFNYTHPDYISLRILNTILGGYFGSRLMTNIREDKGYTYGINSNIISLYNSGYFFISSQVDAGSAQLAINEIYHEIKRLQQDKVSDSELNLVKNYMFGNFLRSIDGPFAMASLNKILIEYNLDKDYFYRYLDKIINITSEEIIDTAQKYLQTETMLQVVVGKK
jgi:zinc protease